MAKTIVIQEPPRKKREISAMQKAQQTRAALMSQPKHKGFVSMSEKDHRGRPGVVVLADINGVVFTGRAGTEVELPVEAARIAYRAGKIVGAPPPGEQPIDPTKPPPFPKGYTGVGPQFRIALNPLHEDREDPAKRAQLEAQAAGTTKGIDPTQAY